MPCAYRSRSSSRRLRDSACVWLHFEKQAQEAGAHRQRSCFWIPVRMPDIVFLFRSVTSVKRDVFCSRPPAACEVPLAGAERRVVDAGDEVGRRVRALRDLHSSLAFSLQRTLHVYATQCAISTAQVCAVPSQRATKILLLKLNLNVFSSKDTACVRHAECNFQVGAVSQKEGTMMGILCFARTAAMSSMRHQPRVRQDRKPQTSLFKSLPFENAAPHGPFCGPSRDPHGGRSAPRPACTFQTSRFAA